MVKKVVKKTVTETVHEDISSKKTPSKPRKVNKEPKAPKDKKMTASEREQLLIENFVGLQHAMTNLSIKFGNLSDNISKLLEVYEEAAKNYLQGGKTDNEDMLKKINSLLEQNKTIAKGLVLMEGKLRGASENPAPPQRLSLTRPRPLPSI